MDGKTIRVLAVGNSFTQDSFRYLHQIAAADGVDLKAVNLYIGGCSLERHWNNLVSGARDYVYEVNGEPTERMVSSNEILAEEPWDYIITQQASHDSGMPETYEPYVVNVVHAFREKCPGAEVLLQETWAYERDSTHDRFPRYHCDQQEMYEKLRACYRNAAEKAETRLIPSGDVIQTLRGRDPFRYEAGGLSLCRDGFHMSFDYGRYLLGIVIYSFLTGKDIRENTFMPQDTDAAVLRLIRETAWEVLNPGK
ncbi:MAG: DUF4886 domain-containing protein [Firmicutes bacterium]|nr:DUF4886 domain-containing protein [Bacillota bacterium]